MKILILCDHYPLSPRVKKIRNSLLELYPDSSIKVYAWNREANNVLEDYVVPYTQRIGYGNKFRKVYNIFKFIKNAKKFSDEYEPNYIHAIDFEMLIVANSMLKKEKIVYEIYDIKFYSNRILDFLREKLEFSLIKKCVYAIILASPFFESYYQKKGIETKSIVINNKPSKIIKKDIQNGYMDNYKSLLPKDKIVVGFVGTIRYPEVLMNLIDASINIDNVVILMAGGGPSYDDIRNYILDKKLESKIILTGRFNNADLPSIYEACDYVWAAYPSESLNVKYAISNKFFESIVFGKKMIVSNNTKLGDYVNKSNIGLTINPYDIDEISTLLKSLKEYDSDGYKNNFKNNLYWEDEEKKLTSIYN